MHNKNSYFVPFIQDRLTFIIIAFIMLIALLILGWLSFKNIFNAALEVLVAPASAEVKINGKIYQNGTYENMRPQTLQVEISKDGFQSESFELELAANTTTKLYVALKGNDDWYQDPAHENDQNIMWRVNEYNGELETNEYQKKYPILIDLPIVVESYSSDRSKYTHYRIDGGSYDGCEKELCLKITDISGGNHEAALEKIRKLGYSPEDYTILYEDKSGKGHAF